MKTNIIKILFSWMFLVALGNTANAQRYQVDCGNEHMQVQTTNERGLGCGAPSGSSTCAVAADVGNSYGTANCTASAEAFGNPVPPDGDTSVESCKCVDCETDGNQVDFLSEQYFGAGSSWFERFTCEGYLSPGCTWVDQGPCPAGPGSCTNDGGYNNFTDSPLACTRAGDGCPIPNQSRGCEFGGSAVQIQCVCGAGPTPTPGPGLQFQNVFCQDNGNPGVPVADALCAAAGPKPPTSQACGGGTCTITAGTSFGGSCQADSDVNIADGATGTATDATGPDTGSADWDCAAGVPTGPNNITCSAGGCGWTSSGRTTGMATSESYGSIDVPPSPGGAADTETPGASTSCSGLEHNGRTGRTLYADGGMFYRHEFTCDCPAGPSLAGSCNWEVTDHQWHRDITDFSPAWTGVPTEAFTGQDILAPPVAACNAGRDTNVAYNQYDLGAAGPQITLPGEGFTENRKHITEWTCNCYAGGGCTGNWSALAADRYISAPPSCASLSATPGGACDAAVNRACYTADNGGGSYDVLNCIAANPNAAGCPANLDQCSEEVTGSGNLGPGGPGPDERIRRYNLTNTCNSRQHDGRQDIVQQNHSTDDWETNQCICPNGPDRAGSCQWENIEERTKFGAPPGVDSTAFTGPGLFPVAACAGGNSGATESDYHDYGTYYMRWDWECACY